LKESGFWIAHVLAAPFSTYQFALLGADVIKVRIPIFPTWRQIGSDATLNAAYMGTAYLARGQTKRALALDLKTEGA